MELLPEIILSFGPPFVAAIVTYYLAKKIRPTRKKSTGKNGNKLKSTQDETHGKAYRFITSFARYSHYWVRFFLGISVLQLCLVLMEYVAWHSGMFKNRLVLIVPMVAFGLFLVLWFVGYEIIRCEESTK